MRNALRKNTIGSGTASLKQGTVHQPKAKRGARFFQVELTNRASFDSKFWGLREKIRVKDLMT